MKIYREWLDEGFSRAGGGKDLSKFDIAPSVQIALGDDVAACRDKVKPFIALYVGGMGAREKNFYFNLVCRYGYEEAAHKIQDLFLSGRKAEAIAAVPDELVDEVALCGPRERIAERVTAWQASDINTLICAGPNPAALRLMAELAL
jgi:alkanesulfonate monooxygenase SsuD/methylene tetrahydromethanopterin reductase-like flavin-dependent oxidoreductase (luciferase family)